MLGAPSLLSMFSFCLPQASRSCQAPVAGSSGSTRASVPAAGDAGEGLPRGRIVWPDDDDDDDDDDKDEDEGYIGADATLDGSTQPSIGGAEDSMYVPIQWPEEYDDDSDEDRPAQTPSECSTATDDLTSLGSFSGIDSSEEEEVIDEETNSVGRKLYLISL
mmetsp:Transcript_96049/g.248856  ORF Transcript_96049/g.248856 Transcript_96049/m.248856 type:complete len:162 (-) Transcript_96049:36-521(-)